MQYNGDLLDKQMCYMLFYAEKREAVCKLVTVQNYHSGNCFTPVEFNSQL